MCVGVGGGKSRFSTRTRYSDGVREKDGGRGRRRWIRFPATSSQIVRWERRGGGAQKKSQRDKGQEDCDGGRRGAWGGIGHVRVAADWAAGWSAALRAPRSVSLLRSEPLEWSLSPTDATACRVDYPRPPRRAPWRDSCSQVVFDHTNNAGSLIFPSSARKLTHVGKVPRVRRSGGQDGAMSDRACPARARGSRIQSVASRRGIRERFTKTISGFSSVFQILIPPRAAPALLQLRYAVKSRRRKSCSYFICTFAAAPLRFRGTRAEH